MITVAPDRPAGQSAAMHHRAVLGFLDKDSECPQALRHCRNPITFLHPKLADTGKRRFAARERRSHEQHREFVDRKRNKAWINGPALQLGRPDANIRDRFLTQQARVFEADIGTHVLQDVDDAGPRRIYTHILDQYVGIVGDQCREYHECRRRQVGRNLDCAALGLLATLQADTPVPRFNFHAHRREHAFGMVARNRRFTDTG